MSKEKTEHSFPATQSGEVDARMYKFMFEWDQRLDTKFKDARIQHREDISNALIPVNLKLSALDERMAEGNKRFERLEDDNDDGTTSVHISKSSALERKRGGMIAVDKIPAILQGLGVLIATVFSCIAMLRNPAPPNQTTNVNQPAAAQPPASTTPP